MIRHIVTWKLIAQDDAAKVAAVATIAGVLEPLAGLVPGIHSLTVRPNAAYPEANWDVVLVGEYESLDSLQHYMTHPDHLAAVTVVRQHVSERASIDVEL